MRTAGYICLLLPMALMGCTKDEVPIVSVVEAEPPSLPAECTAPDAAWKELPEADVMRSEAVKNYDQNKGQYNRILNRRSVCRAAINAISKG